MGSLLIRTTFTKFEDAFTEWLPAWLDSGLRRVNALGMHGDNAGIMARNTYAVVEIR